MKKQYITFDCQHQKISRTDDFYVVGGSQKYLYAKFSFCEDWDGKRQYAVFTGGGNAYRVEIVNGECEVPWEVLLTKRFFVGCEAGQRITSNAAEVVVHPCGAPEETDTPRPPTPTLQTQIGYLSDLQTDAKDNLVAAINELKEAGGGSATPGADGGYYTPSVTQPNANTMRMDFAPSKADMQPVAGVEIALPAGPAGQDGKPGSNGAPGYTPQKGVDYFTPEDKAEMVNDVLAALPVWKGGSY